MQQTGRKGKDKCIFIDLNFTQHNWDELKCRMQAHPFLLTTYYLQTSVIKDWGGWVVVDMQQNTGLFESSVKKK